MAKQLLKAHADSFPLERYEDAVSKLSESPTDRTAQHQAVLSLARLGSTDFALQEYMRYGLHLVEGDEDIVALKARLLKDHFLQSEGQTAQDYALKSAHQYDDAYQQTAGYYSGINAATMFRLSNQNDHEVQSRARKILDNLPDVEHASAQEYYFVSATRAEAHLLLGDIDRARHALQQAVDFDPLNYIAHAATLKQFGLILRHENRSAAWLSDFQPPRPVYFAGHIWPATESIDEDAVKTSLSDYIQKYDLGFAYGALAAGADIIIAECCLAEGVPLHLVLPNDVERFCDTSVRPFGESWVHRYRACLARATSLTCLSHTKHQSSDLADAGFAAEVSMGQTILRSREFARSPVQLLLLDDARPESLSHRLKPLWAQTGFESLVLPVKLRPKSQRSPSPFSRPCHWTVHLSESKSYTIDIDPENLLDEILTIRDKSPRAPMIIGCTDEVEPAAVKHLLDRQLPPTIFLTDSVAALLTIYHPAKNFVTFAGLAKSADGSDSNHIYTLNPPRT